MLVSGSSLAPWSERWHKPVLIVFLGCWSANAVLLSLRMPAPDLWPWLDGLSLLLAVGTTLLGLGRGLPLQNVLMIAGLIAFLAGAVLGGLAVSPVPLGPVQYSDRLGTRIAGLVPWPLLGLWVVVVINAQSVAQLILQRWRQTHYYGFWLMGVAAMLVTGFNLALEPFAVRVKGWWTWHSTTWVICLVWFAATGIFLFLTTPWFISKQPVQRPPAWHPLVVWLMLSLTLTAGLASQGLWPAAGTTLIANVLVTAFAFYGAVWKTPPPRSFPAHGCT